MKENQSIDEFIKELTVILKEMGLEKPVYANNKGSLIMINLSKNKMNKE